MNLEVHENTVSWLPQITIDLLPDNLPKTIRIYSDENRLGIEANGVVGSIPLKDGRTIHIIPKIGTVNFLRLLFRAEGNLAGLKNEFESFVTYSQAADSNIIDLVADRLFVAADEILRKSPLFSRTSKRTTQQYFGGRVDLVSSLRRLERRQERPVSTVIKFKSIDIAENRILSAALQRAWAMLPATDKIKYEEIYQKWLHKFPPSKDLNQDLKIIEQGFSRNTYGGSRDYYRRALMFCQIILGASGMGYTGKPTITGQPILINTADVFEKYVRQVISESYTPKAFLISKGGVNSRYLYSDGSYELIPDISISRDNTVLLLADAKYKKPSSSDHYQMITYLNASKLNVGILIAPNFISNDVSVKSYKTLSGVIVKELYLPMEDLQKSEQALSGLLTL